MERSRADYGGALCERIMNILKKIKNGAYSVKLFFISVFCYPAQSIPEGDRVDYDAYWAARRDAGSIGMLSRWQKERADAVLATISLDAQAHITDLGCGDGGVLRYLEQKCKGIKGFGIDMSDFALKKAREFGVQTRRADITDLRELEHLERADYFLLFEILEHIPHSEQFLKIVYEKADRGVFFSIPNSGFLAYRLRLLFGKFPAQWRIHPAEHLRFWTVTDVRWSLSALGIPRHKIFFYQGIPFLNKIFPSLCAAGIIVYLPKR